ncbi:hypothetical protein CB1_001753002 [Camelus ferus]|nr:hypothetical protein CB1_001753002 [Camelus ferus]
MRRSARERRAAQEGLSAQQLLLQPRDQGLLLLQLPDLTFSEVHHQAACARRFTGSLLQVTSLRLYWPVHTRMRRNGWDSCWSTVCSDISVLLAGPPGPPSNPITGGSGTSWPLFDSGLHLNGNSGPTQFHIRNERQDIRYVLEEESGAFKVLAPDGGSTGLLQCHTAQDSADWLRAVSANISHLTLQNCGAHGRTSARPEVAGDGLLVLIPGQCRAPRATLAAQSWLRPRATVEEGPGVLGRPLASQSRPQQQPTAPSSHVPPPSGGCWSSFRPCEVSIPQTMGLSVALEVRMVNTGCSPGDQSADASVLDAVPPPRPCAPAEIWWLMCSFSPAGCAHGVGQREAGWGRLLSDLQTQVLALKGSSFHVFVAPPLSSSSIVCSGFWTTAGHQLPSLGSGGPDGQDHGPYCFSVLGGHGASHVFSVGLGSELAVWERSFQRAALLEVQRAGVECFRPVTGSNGLVLGMRSRTSSPLKEGTQFSDLTEELTVSAFDVFVSQLPRNTQQVLPSQHQRLLPLQVLWLGKLRESESVTLRAHAQTLTSSSRVAPMCVQTRNAHRGRR